VVDIHAVDCKKCAYFSGTEDYRGFCLRRAPRFRNEAGVGEWPLVSKYDSCGEYEERKR